MSPRRRFTIDADLHAEPIEGSVHRDGAPLREFVGWLGLLQVLEDLAIAEVTRTAPDGAGRAATAPARP